jgi:2-dehydropantoate 2-reductase
MSPRIAIVGSGAIGTYYGTRLALAGADVRFLLRGDLDVVSRRGSLRINLRDGQHELRPAQVFGATAEIGPVGLVIVTLKTTANRELNRLLPPLLSPATAILTLQNGLGSDEAIAADFGPERVLGGLAFIAVTRTGPGEVACHHPGSLTLGEFGRRPLERTRQLALQFEAAGVETRVAANLLEARWRKLVWNIPFNGLAIARGGITTDKLCADPVLAGEVRELMGEVQHAAAGFGFTIPDDFLKQQFDMTPPMGAYPPSSLVDFFAGREVEVEAIWGEPLRRAQAAGVAVPRLATLHAELCRLCAR